MSKRKHEEEEHIDESWLVPYADVLTLLLALFIVLFATSKVDSEKFKQMADSFREAFSGTSSNQGILTGEGAIISIAPASPPEKTGSGTDESEMNEDEMNAALNEFIQSNNMQNMVSIVSTKGGFTVRILDSVMFATGSDQIGPQAYALLNKISEVASKSPYYLSIEGHTDNTPARPPYTNWSLSVNRAVSVLNYMLNQGVNPQKLSAVGYSEYHPLFPNITEENRMKNRRVEINFVSPQFFERSHEELFN